MNIGKWKKVDIICYGKTITVGLHLWKMVNIKLSASNV